MTDLNEKLLDYLNERIAGCQGSNSAFSTVQLGVLLDVKAFLLTDGKLYQPTSTSTYRTSRTKNEPAVL